MMTQTRSSLRQHVKLILACLASVGTVSSASTTEAAYRCADGTAVRCLQCFRANGIGAADFCWQGRQCLAAAGSLCRRRKIRRQRHGILDRGEDGAIDARRSCNKVQHEVVARRRKNASPFRTSSVPRNSTCHFSSEKVQRVLVRALRARLLRRAPVYIRCRS
jgi:hypothetical protein